MSDKIVVVNTKIHNEIKEVIPKLKRKPSVNGKKDK